MDKVRLRPLSFNTGFYIGRTPNIDPDYPRLNTIIKTNAVYPNPFHPACRHYGAIIKPRRTAPQARQ